MAKFEAHLKCSFCGKAQDQVRKLIAGPGVYICDECIDLCNEILDEELIDNQNHYPGIYDVLLDAKHMSSGSYFINLSSKGKRVSRKIAIVK